MRNGFAGIYRGYDVAAERTDLGFIKSAERPGVVVANRTSDVVDGRNIRHSVIPPKESCESAATSSKVQLPSLCYSPLGVIRLFALWILSARYPGILEGPVV